MEIIKAGTTPKIFDRDIGCGECSCVFKLEDGDQALFLGMLQEYPMYGIQCPHCFKSLWVTYDNDESKHPLIGLLC